MEKSRVLIKHLKIIFAQMAVGDKKYADPTNVLKSITSDSGSPIELGDQKDIGEFNDSFLSRVQEGLNYRALYQEMINLKKNKEK